MFKNKYLEFCRTRDYLGPSCTKLCSKQVDQVYSNKVDPQVEKWYFEVTIRITNPGSGRCLLSKIVKVEISTRGVVISDQLLFSLVQASSPKSNVWTKAEL